MRCGLEERTENYEVLESSLKQVKVAYMSLKERQSEAMENFQAVESVAKNIKCLDPSDNWPIMR